MFIIQSTDYYRRVDRYRLWKLDPYCYWCGIKTLFIRNDRFSTQENNYATIDHIYHKGNPLGIEREDRNICVLACFRCNQDRNYIFLRLYGDKINNNI